MGLYDISNFDSNYRYIKSLLEISKDSVLVCMQYNHKYVYKKHHIGMCLLKIGNMKI